MNSLFHFLLLLCCGSLSLAQHVDFTIQHANASIGYLSSISGESTTRLDSFVAATSGSFRFSLNPSTHPAGVYRFSFDKNKWIDIILDREDVSITTDASAPAESLNVVASESNQLFYSFLRSTKQFKAKSELLQIVLARYPKEDPYYSTTVHTASQLQEEYAHFTGAVSQKNPGSFVARYVRSAQLPVIDLTLSPEKQLARLKAHALDNVDFADEGLIRSDLFAKKSIEYLMYYRNPQLPKELLEKEFNGAVDSILTRARINQNVYKHITEYLIDGFKKFGFEKCIEYILDNYVIKDDLCLDEASGSSIQKMIEQKKHLPTGAQAPDIELPDTAGKEVTLSSIKADKILVVFYSSSCPHCQTMLPKLSELYRARKQKTFEIFAVSLDNNRADWLKFIHANRLEGVNVNDAASWGGIPAIEYHLYATPTMFLLDRDLKIVGKPITAEELRAIPGF